MKVIQKNKIDTIHRYVAGARRCLKSALWRRSPKIAANLTALGKPIGARTVRLMTEPTDIVRRNTIENTLLLLGAAFLDSPKSYETVWQYLQAFDDELRGSAIKFDSIERAVVEFRYKSMSVERVWLDGEQEQLPRAITEAGESLRGVLSHLVLKD